MGVTRLRSLFLTDDGTSSGEANFGVDGTTPVPYWIPGPLAATGYSTLEVYRLVFAIEDTGNFTTATLGAMAAPSNGLTLAHVDGGSIDLLDGQPIKNNARLAELMYDTTLKDWSSGNKQLVGRWTFAKFGGPLCLEAGAKLQLTVSDDLTALVRATVIAQGVYT